MECVTVSTEVLRPQQKRVIRLKSGYEVDFWREVRKRWLVFGVLISVMAAVISPRLGSSGGPLCTAYLRYAPLLHIYYAAGRGAAREAKGAPGGRTAVVSVLHAHVAVPALCLSVLSHTATHPTIAKGALLSSTGAGCGWVSLALCPRAAPAATAALLALNYVSSIVATPLLRFIICGRATIPPLGAIVSTVIISCTPFAVGVLVQQHNRVPENNRFTENNRVAENNRAVKLSALLLLYMDCCDLLREAEGSLYVGDVLCTLLLVVCWVASSAATVGLYARCGLLPAERARLVALTAIPKCLDPGWKSTAACTGTGLSRLPAAFLAPAQTLLLAAMFADDDDVTEQQDEVLTVVQHDG